MVQTVALRKTNFASVATCLLLSSRHSCYFSFLASTWCAGLLASEKHLVSRACILILSCDRSRNKQCTMIGIYNNIIFVLPDASIYTGDQSQCIPKNNENNEVETLLRVSENYFRDSYLMNSKTTITSYTHA